MRPAAKNKSDVKASGSHLSRTVSSEKIDSSGGHAFGLFASCMEEMILQIIHLHHTSGAMSLPRRSRGSQKGPLNPAGQTPRQDSNVSISSVSSSNSARILVPLPSLSILLKTPFVTSSTLDIAYTLPQQVIPCSKVSAKVGAEITASGMLVA